MAFVDAGKIAASVVASIGIPIILIGGGIALIKTTSGFLSRSIPQAIENIKSKFRCSSQMINFNPSQVKERLEKNLESIIGHTREKNKIIDTVLGWIESKNNVDLNHKTGGLVLYLVGPSGTGKTMAADAIQKALLNKKSNTVVVSYSSIDPASSFSVAEQLFGVREELSNGNMKIKKVSPLLNQIRHNPNTVIIINEYDKLQAKDGTLDSCLWDISDNGIMDIKGEKIDCSNVIIIATSNEAASCVGEPDAFVDDGSTTTVVHNKAFINRIKPIVFSGLTSEDYKEILENQLKSVILDYKQKYRLNISLDDSTIEAIVKDIKDANRGAREVNAYITNLYAALVAYRMEHKIPDRKDGYWKSKKCKLLRVSYDSVEHRFEVGGKLRNKVTEEDEKNKKAEISREK